MTDLPIGVFDSGFGGLTVVRAIVDLLPHEDIVYLGDTARAPYGPRPIAEVREHALQGLDFLAERGVKMLVIACNSASSAVLRDARERYDVPIAEVILPTARKAVATTRNNQVGVISTVATATSKSYLDAFTVAPHVRVTQQACPRFVEFVEAGVTGGPELIGMAEEYLEPLRRAGVDTVILGCTHYPLLTGVISYIMGDSVSLISSADECARSAYNSLTRRRLTHDGPRAASREFFTTGIPSDFEGVGRRLMGGLVTGVASVALE